MTDVTCLGLFSSSSNWTMYLKGIFNISLISLPSFIISRTSLSRYSFCLEKEKSSSVNVSSPGCFLLLLIVVLVQYIISAIAMLLLHMECGTYFVIYLL